MQVHKACVCCSTPALSATTSVWLMHLGLWGSDLPWARGSRPHPAVQRGEGWALPPGQTLWLEAAPCPDVAHRRGDHEGMGSAHRSAKWGMHPRGRAPWLPFGKQQQPTALTAPSPGQTSLSPSKPDVAQNTSSRNEIGSGRQGCSLQKKAKWQMTFPTGVATVDAARTREACQCLRNRKERWVGLL